MSDLPPGYTIKKPTYDTQLAPPEEAAFGAWKTQYAPKDSGADYDLRGAFKAGLTPDPATGHWPDTYKKPNHPTFSDQSMYATGENAAKAGRWEGENYIPPAASAGLPEGYTIKGAVSAAPEPQTPMSAAQSIWEGAKSTIGSAAEEAWNRVSSGGNLLGLEGKSALERGSLSEDYKGEFDRPYKPGMTMGQMIPPNWQENPMLGAMGPGNIIGRGAQGLMPRPAPPPTAPPAPPQLLLPPPTVQVAGQPATPTGQLGVPSPWRAGLEADRRTLGEAPPTAPAPAGVPSPFRENLEAGGRTLGEAPPGLPIAQAAGLGGSPRFLPPGPQPGMMPPGPTSTMTSPAATPPPTSPRVAAGLEPPPQTYPQPSALASAIATDNPAAVDQAITRGYRQAIQPGQTGVKMSAPGLAQEDQRIMTTVDQIIAKRNDIKLTNPDGSAVAEGAMPKTRRQFLEAQDQTKKALFREYDEMNRQAGSLGIHVDPAPAINHLREVETNPAIVDAHPSVASEAGRFADAMERRGVYTPEAMQDMIQDLNGRLASFYKNPGAGSASEARVLAPVVDMLRNQLDNAIEGAVGPGYQAFRTQYGALRSVEKDLTNAARKELSQRPGFISEYADLLASESFIRGVFTLNPGTVARAGVWKIVKEIVKYSNDPNRAVERLFQRRLSSQTQPSPSLGQSLMMPAARELSRPEIEQDQGGVGYRMPRVSIGGP